MREEEPGEEDEGGGEDVEDKEEKLWKAMARKVEEVRQEERARAREREAEPHTQRRG